MIPRIKELIPKDNFLLYITFDDGKKVAYDVMEDIKQIPSYIILQTTKGLFKTERSLGCLHFVKGEKVWLQT